MKITFCLPACYNIPIGGYKIVYEYANRLVEKGHQITIAYDHSGSLLRYKVPKIVKKYGKIYMAKRKLTWFNLNKKIKRISTEHFAEKQMPDSDIIIATEVGTAEPVRKLPESKGKKFYFIQDFECWKVSEETVKETYNYGMRNIVISKWLKEIVDDCTDKESILIPNGIDFHVFDIDRKIESRNPYSIAFLYYKGLHKGTKYSIETVGILKKKYPQLKVHAFGLPDRPDELPEWIEYTPRATQIQLRKIYNQASVFICSTIDEGFGLTGAESMACGCCFISTDYTGVHEYAINLENALLSPIESPKEMVDNVIKVMENDDLRIRLAKKGHEDVKKLSWDRSIELFERALKQ